MTTLPTTLAMIAASITTTALFSDQNADFNNDGTVDSTDLMQVTSQLGTVCEGDCPTDLNQDGITNSTDITFLMDVWGAVPGWVDPNADADSGQNEEEVPRAPVDLSWQGQGPVLLDAIYYDQYTEFYSHGGYNRWNSAKEYNQGEYTKAWAAANGVAVQPTIYGSVDWDHDNNLTEEDKENFAIWLNEYVPADYSGPLCLDLEGQWWGMLDTSNQAVMDSVINVYLEHLEVAKALRPNAKIGFWGFPKKTHTNPDFNTASVERLVSKCTAIFRDVYEWNPGVDNSARLQLHVERAMKMVNGQTPVYVQTSPRYKTSPTSPRYIHNQAEFMHDQVGSALAAVWTDADGKDHRIQGIGFWDAYTYVAQFTDGWSEMDMDERKTYWNELDNTHVSFLTEMKTYIDAACAAAEERKSLAQKQMKESQSITVQAKATEAEAQMAEKSTAPKQQRTRLVRKTSPGKTMLTQSKESYRKSVGGYRISRGSWLSAKRAFEIAKRRHPRGTKQYKLALEEYKEALQQFQSASRSFRKNRKAYRTARANLNNYKKQLQIANAK